MKTTKNHTQKGASLYIAFMVMSLSLGIALGLSSLLIDQMKSLRQISFSILALEAADAGIEQTINIDQKMCASNANRVNCVQANIPSNAVILPNGASYNVSVEAAGKGACPGCSSADDLILRSVRYTMGKLYDSSSVYGSFTTGGGYYETPLSYYSPCSAPGQGLNIRYYNPDQWTDAAAIAILNLKDFSQEYRAEIKKSLNFLLFMKRNDNFLFYDFYDADTRERYDSSATRPCVGIIDDAQLYRAAWASIALREGYELFKNEDSDFADSLRTAALGLLQNGEQDAADGGWINPFINTGLKHKTIKDNSLMLLYLLSLKQGGFNVPREKIDKTADWILSMQDNSNYGFHSVKELDVVYAPQYSDANALAAWALEEYDNDYSNIDLSGQLDNWFNEYVPLVADRSVYGSPTKWGFESDIGASDGNRSTYIAALYALAFSSMGISERAYVFNWIEDFRNTSGADKDGYGIGYEFGTKRMTVNSETHPLVILALSNNPLSCVGYCASSVGEYKDVLRAIRISR